MAEKLHKWETYCFLMNSVVGAGILAIPGAFQHNGVLASAVLLSVVMLLNWVVHVELLAVTEKLTLSALSDESIKQQLLPELHLLTSEDHWDLPEIVGALFGRTHKSIYFLFFAGFIIGTISAYTNIFGTAFGSFLHCDYTVDEVSEECRHTYLLGTGVFTVLVCILTALDYKEQSWVQYLMTGLQFTMAGFVILYCVLRESTGHLTFANVVVAGPSEMGSTFAILVFSVLYIIVFPSLFAVSNRHHRAQKQVAAWVSISTFALYCFFGTICALLIEKIPSNVSLYFKEEVEKLGEIAVPSMLLLLTYVVIIAPAIDITTNAPIYGHALAGGVITSIYGTNHQEIKRLHPILYRLIRVICVLPAFFLASLSTKLVTIT